MNGQGPVGDIGDAGTGVVEFDERVGRIGGARADTKLIDLNRADIAGLPGDCLGMSRAALRVCP